MKPDFRALTAGDGDALGTFLERNDAPEITAHFDPFPLTAATARDLVSEERRDRFYGAFEGPHLVALSMLRGWDEGYEVPSFGILVDREHHGRGVGSRLTDYTIEEARRLGCAAIRLSVYATNRVAHQMYRARGFVEEQREQVTRPYGADERIVMRKRIDPTSEPPRRIPVAEPALVGNEEKYVLDCVRSTWISSTGEYIARFETAFADFCETRHAISCCNGTSALHLALHALGVGPGDEVIVPTLTYVASANAVAYCGARPVFVDSEPETWNMDPDAVAEAVTEKTKGIMAVHLYGHPADMDPLLAVAEANGLFVVEDAAEAHGARYRDRAVGALGRVGIFSFYGNKVITTGEGGMIVSNDDALAARMRQLRGQGQDPERRYWFPVIGFNYRMTNVAAAIGLAQLERIDWHVSRRREVAEQYRHHLGEQAGLRLSPELSWARNAFWMNCAVLPDGVDRDTVMERLAAAGVETRPFFYPVHTLPPYADNQPGLFPVADHLAAQGINLPSGATLTADDVEHVSSALLASLS